MKKDACLSVQGKTLNINDFNNFHIQQIEVFTGNDDNQETDCIEVYAKGDRLVAKQLITNSITKSLERIRYEPGVRIHLQCETSNPGITESIVLTICHHKGNVVARVNGFSPTIGLNNVV